MSDPGCCHSWQVMKGMPPRSELEFGLVKQGIVYQIWIDIEYGGT